MSESIITPPKRIFVIGPMTEGKEDPQGLPYEQHIPNIVTATRNVLERLRAKLGDALPDCQVIDPPNRPAGIPRDVFSHIMHCNFAIADISNASPNVIYEIAMLHANGTPVILLGDPIFYLNQQNCLACADFEVATLEAALAGSSFDETDRKGQLETLMTAPPREDFRNPITEFFEGVHLVNVAAAAGVATGNFYNFTSYVLKRGGLFKSRPNLKKLVLIRPERIGDVDRCVGLLEEAFSEPILDRETQQPVRDRDGNPLMSLPKLWQNDDAHPRGTYFAYQVGNNLVDYPTPISSLEVSKQYLAMGDYVQRNATGFSAEETDAFEKRLIDVYFDTLRDLARRHPSGCDWGRVEILSIEDAIEFLRADLT